MICISSSREETSGRKCNDDTMAMMICLLACALFLFLEFVPSEVKGCGRSTRRRRALHTLTVFSGGGESFPRFL